MQFLPARAGAIPWQADLQLPAHDSRFLDASRASLQRQARPYQPRRPHLVAQRIAPAESVALYSVGLLLIDGRPLGCVNVSQGGVLPISTAVIELAAGNHQMVAWTLVAHVFGFVLWIAGLLATTVILAQHSQETSTEARRTLARIGRICMRGLADPGAFLTLLAGVILITTNRTYYLHARWLHIKLVFVAVLIVLHGLVAIRNKSMLSGGTNFPSTHAKILFVAILLVFLLILISTLPGEVFLT
jgi:putative membrane protein